MKTALEFLKEHIKETNIPEEHYEWEIAEIMDLYADYYHESKVKNLTIPRVSQQSELLNDFLVKLRRLLNFTHSLPLPKYVEFYLKGIL